MKVLIANTRSSDFHSIVSSLNLLLAQKPAHCTNVRQFQQAIEAEKFDVILSDYRLGDVLALELLERYRKICTCAPFIVIASDLSNQQIIELLQGGVTDFVSTDDLGRLDIVIERAIRECKTKSELEKLVNHLRERENKLRQSEAKYRKVVENQSEMIIRWDANGKVNFANQSFLDYHEVDFDHFAKQSYFDFVQDKERFKRKIAALSVENPEITDVHSHVNKSRGNVWHEWSDHAFFNSRGELIEIQSIGRDITQQKNVELEIRESEEFNQSVLSALNAYIAVVDKNGLVVATNDTWRNFTLKNVVLISNIHAGTNYFKICQRAIERDDQLAPLALQGIKDVLSQRQNLFEMEYSCFSHIGRRWFLLRVSPFRARLEGAVISFVDITDKKEQALELETTYREILSIEKINRALVTGKSTSEMATLILDGLYEATGIHQSRIYLYSDQEHKLDLFAQRMSSKVAKILESKIGNKTKTTAFIPTLEPGSLFDSIIREKKELVTDDEEMISRLVSEYTTSWVFKKMAVWVARIVGLCTYGVYPLVDKDKVIGMLSIGATTRLTDREKSVVSRYAQQVATILSKKQQDDNLAQNEEKFKAISNYTANWETWLDTSGKPIWMNPGVIDMIGYSAEEMLAMPDFLGTIVYQEDFPRVIEKLRAALSEKTEGDHFEFRGNHRNGTFPWFSVSWKQVYDVNGKWLGIRSSALDITQKKIQEQELIRRENLLNETQKIAKLGSWTWSPVTNRITMSAQMAATLEIEDTENYHHVDSIIPFIHPDTLAWLSQGNFKSISDFRASEFEMKMLTATGAERTVLIRANDEPLVPGDADTVYGTALDITELKQSQERMMQSEFRFRKIFETIHDVYYQATPEGIITLVSPSVKNLLGYDPEELLGRPITELYADPKVRELNVARLRAGQNATEFETSMVARNGAEVIVSINLNRLLTDNSWVIQGLMRNITERKKQEIRLESQRLKLLEANKLNTQIIETSDRFFYVLRVKRPEGIDHELKYISPQIKTIAGIAESELMSTRTSWSGIIHAEDLVYLQAGMKSLFDYSQPVEVEYRVYNRELNRYVWVEDYACPLVDDSGGIIEIYGSVKDITERKNAEKKIENEKKQALAYQFQLLSSQLNPHFIYNTLNSFQYYILNGNIEESLNHISDFSVLMRKAMENSMYQHISIQDELNFLGQFVLISRQRLKKELDFAIEIQDGFEISENFIPPMLLQPYVENAIIHGFADSPRDPRLVVTISEIDDRIFCSIEDNGIGRAASQKQREVRHQFGQQSFAMGINQKRINLLNQISKNDFKVEVLDLTGDDGNPCGTRVVLNYYRISEELSDEDF